jgi:hypothetical protein
MYGIRSLASGGPPIPRPRPEERAKDSLANYKLTPREQRFFSRQDAETQALIDSLLAEQQRGAEETELDMIIRQQNEKFPDPLAVLGYETGNIYGKPVGTGNTNFLGLTETRPGVLRKHIEESEFLPKQFVPPSDKLSAYVQTGAKKPDESSGFYRNVEGITPEGMDTILHELRHLALQNPGMKALLDENKIKEEPFVRVLDYLRAKEIGDEEGAKAEEEYLRYKYAENPLTFYKENKPVFDEIMKVAQQSLDYMKHLREQSEDNSGE